MNPSQFLNSVRIRNESASLSSIGQELGVSAVAVHRWLRGERKPTRTVLLLAERVWGVQEMAPGLPIHDIQADPS